MRGEGRRKEREDEGVEGVRGVGEGGGRRGRWDEREGGSVKSGMWHKMATDI